MLPQFKQKNIIVSYAKNKNKSTSLYFDLKIDITSVN